MAIGGGRPLPSLHDRGTAWQGVERRVRALSHRGRSDSALSAAGASATRA